MPPRAISKPSVPPRRGEPAKTNESRTPAAKSTATGIGWGAVANKKLEDEERKRRREEKAGNIWDFYLRDGESAIIQILNDEPLCMDGHTVFDDGKNFTFLACQLEIQKHCLMCRDDSPLTWKAGFKVLDFREKNKKGDYVYSDKPTEKRWLIGTQLAQQLKAFKDKKGKELTDMVIEITRTGAGAKDTTYNLAVALYEDDTKIEPIEWEQKFPSIEDICAPLEDDQFIDGGYTIPEPDPKNKSKK
jgi:hypothetical protein